MNELEKEIEDLLTKKDSLYTKLLSGYDTGSNSRKKNNVNKCRNWTN